MLNINFASSDTEQKNETSDNIGEFFSLYENKQYGFSIDYPPYLTAFDHNEKTENSVNVVNFSSSNWFMDYTPFRIYYTEDDVTFSGLDDKAYLDKMFDFYKKRCDDAQITEDLYDCSNFNLVASKSFTMSGYQVYQIEYTYTKLYYDSIDHKPYTYDVIVKINQIPRGGNTIILKTVSDIENYSTYGNDLMYMAKSFRMLDSHQEQTIYDTSLTLQVKDGSDDRCLEVYPQLTYGTGSNLDTDDVYIYTDMDMPEYAPNVPSNDWSEICVEYGTQTIWAEVPQLKDVDDPAIIYLNSTSNYVNYNVAAPILPGTEPDAAERYGEPTSEFDGVYLFQLHTLGPDTSDYYFFNVTNGIITSPDDILSGRIYSDGTLGVTYSDCNYPTPDTIGVVTGNIHPETYGGVMWCDDGPSAEWDAQKIKLENTKIEGTNYSVDYVISGGTLSGIESDISDQSLILSIDADLAGDMTIILPREIMEPMLDDQYYDFLVFIDGMELDEHESSETHHETFSTINIQFTPGKNIVKIVGSRVVPEFESITILVLMTSIVLGIILPSKMTNLHMSRIS